MSLSDDWWTKNFDDEPCDGCGTKPSKHEGYGSYTCKKCFDARWCPKCSYGLYTRDGSPHVCVTPEQKYIDQRNWEIEEILLDMSSTNMHELVAKRVDEERDAILQYLRECQYVTSANIDFIENNRHRRTK